MYKFRQSEALTSHFENFWSIVYCTYVMYVCGSSRDSIPSFINNVSEDWVDISVEKAKSCTCCVWICTMDFVSSVLIYLAFRKLSESIFFLDKNWLIILATYNFFHYEKCHVQRNTYILQNFPGKVSSLVKVGTGKRNGKNE